MLNIRAKTIKFLKENIGVNLQDLGTKGTSNKRKKLTL